MKTADEVLVIELNSEMLKTINSFSMLKEWIKDAMYVYAVEYHLNELKETEMKKIKQQMEEDLKLLISFLDWMNETASKNPMIFETDHEDIARMFLEKSI